MLKCDKCGTQITERANFCYGCGRKVSEIKAAQERLNEEAERQRKLLEESRIQQIKAREEQVARQIKMQAEQNRRMQKSNIENNNVDCDGFYTDARDGHIYKTVKIGTQVWMAENLCYKGCGSIAFSKDPSMVYYPGETADYAAPEGWHLPSVAEVEELFTYCEENAECAVSTALKSVSEWKEDSYYDDEDNEHPIPKGEDAFGFNARPCGIIWSGDNGISEIGRQAIFWTSNVVEGWNGNTRTAVRLDSGCIEVFCQGENYSLKSAAPIRCIKD